MSGLYDFPRPVPEIAVPVWPAEIVLVNEIELDRIRQRVSKPAGVEDVAPEGFRARVRWVWGVIEREAPDIIERAERFLTAPGPEKKAAVVAWLNKLVDLLEKLVDIPVIPAALEGLVWRLIRRKIPGIVQRVFEDLAEDGRVNAPEGPGAAS